MIQHKLDKNLGQHFLVNQGVVQKIVEKVKYFRSQDKLPEVVEVGPGGGALTGELLKQGIRVVAVEFDERWAQELNLKFKDKVESGLFEVLCADATTIGLSEIHSRLNNPHITLCGNLPYNRGQEIVFRFFEQAKFVDSFVVMLQKEVIDKFLPRNSRKCYGPLSVKMHFMAENVDSFFVSPGSFNPPPKVDSAVLSFRRKEHEFSPVVDTNAYDVFSRFLQKSFLQRRKKLSNNLEASDFSSEFSLYAAKRAEELSPHDFLKLFSLKIR